MPIGYAKPRFGARIRADYYYEAVTSIIAELRDTGTLRAIAQRLNESGWLTPTDLPWNRQRVANYLRCHMTH